jgi:cell division protein DivIC
MRYLSFLKNKYLLTTLFFIVWLGFFDKNDFFSQMEYKSKLHALEIDKKYYLEEIRKNHTDMVELMTNPKNLEKFAREKYLMKRENEDIFVLVDTPVLH